MGAISIILLSLTLTLSIPVPWLCFVLHASFASYRIQLEIPLSLLRRKFYEIQGKLKHKYFGRLKLQVRNINLPEIYNLCLKTRLISSLSFWFLSGPASRVVVALITLSAPPSRHWITELRPAILTIELRLELSARPGWISTNKYLPCHHTQSSNLSHASFGKP